MRHFVGAGWEHATARTRLTWSSWPGSPRRSRGWRRTSARQRGPGRAVQRRMLGEHRPTIDIEHAARPRQPGRRGGGRVATPSTNVPEQVRRLRRDLEATIAELGLTPGHVKRVVDTALDLDDQQPLRPCFDERQLAEGLWDVPALTESWERATEGLTDKLEREGEQRRGRSPSTRRSREGAGRRGARPPRAPAGRPVDPAAAGRGVEHRHRPAPGHRRGQRRPGAGGTCSSAAYARFVLVGADGDPAARGGAVRGRVVPRDAAGSARVENLTVLGGLLDRALTEGTPRRAGGCAGWSAGGRGPRDPSAGRWSAAPTTGRPPCARKLDRAARTTSGAGSRPELDRFAATLRSALADGEAERGHAVRRPRRATTDETPSGGGTAQSWRERLDQLADRAGPRDRRDRRPLPRRPAAPRSRSP